MSTITVTKEFTFDCAHMLSNHNGLCANIHGHTYKLQVGLIGSPSTEEFDTEEGMIIDFKELKEIIKTLIIDRFDHAFITWTEGNLNEIKIAELIKELDMRIVEVPFRTTAENMAQYFYNLLQETYLGPHIEICYIRLFETPTSFVEVYGE